ncbi:hypothetical protein HZH66_012094 [Vespula vulgaris]|uniref:Uncharacterized protein n=1 Tax=Vespula vulgaris TaxID=7454 RepID=A0A834MVY9_VESVU|nr:hypothetical protein HZH66_012094 [Vespula vulgaris]
MARHVCVWVVSVWKSMDVESATADQFPSSKFGRTVGPSVRGVSPGNLTENLWSLRSYALDAARHVKHVPTADYYCKCAITMIGKKVEEMKEDEEEVVEDRRCGGAESRLSAKKQTGNRYPEHESPPSLYTWSGLRRHCSYELYVLRGEVNECLDKSSRDERDQLRSLLESNSMKEKCFHSRIGECTGG